MSSYTTKKDQVLVSVQSGKLLFKLVQNRLYLNVQYEQILSTMSASNQRKLHLLFYNGTHFHSVLKPSQKNNFFLMQSFHCLFTANYFGIHYDVADKINFNGSIDYEIISAGQLKVTHELIHAIKYIT